MKKVKGMNHFWMIYPTEIYDKFLSCPKILTIEIIVAQNSSNKPLKKEKKNEQ